MEILKAKRKVLIIENSLFFARSLHKYLMTEGYDVVEMNGSMDEAIKLIEAHSPDIITLELALEDGSGLIIIEHLVTHIQKLQVLPLIAVSSGHVNTSERSYINKCLSSSNIKAFYFNKNSLSSLNQFSEYLLLSESYFKKNANPDFNSAYLVIETPDASMDALEIASRAQLKKYPIADNSRAFDYLVFLIQAYATVPPREKLLTVLYARAGAKFDVEPESVKMSIKRLNLSPSPKKFISHVAHQIKTEHPEFIS